MTTSEPDDAELWRQAVAGSGAAFGELFDRHARAIYNHCFRLTASWSTAEDLVQATFVLAWRKRHQLRLGPSESVRPWLLALATNVTRNEQRSLVRRLRLAYRLPAERPVDDPADAVATKVDDERRMAELLRAIRVLPRNQREALALCVWSGVPYADAAAALGIKESSVRARVSKARAALAASLGGPGPAAAVALATNPREDR